MVTLMDVVAAAGMSFGLTAITLLSVRSEGNVKMGVWTFIWTWAALAGIFAWADLPDDLAIQVSGTGVALGLFCTALLFVAKKFEKKFEKPRLTRIK